MEPPEPLEVRLIETDEAIAAAFPFVLQLRPRLRDGGAAGFVRVVRLQARDGYRLFGAFRADRLVGLAGVRIAHTLSRGPHLFVDDLVTDESVRGQGVGTAFVRWLRGHAAEQGLPRVYLDIREAARRFYERLGGTFMTSIPCWIEADGGQPR